MWCYRQESVLDSPPLDLHSALPSAQVQLPSSLKLQRLQKLVPRPALSPLDLQERSARVHPQAELALRLALHWRQGLHHRLLSHPPLRAARLALLALLALQAAFHKLVASRPRRCWPGGLRWYRRPHDRRVGLLPLVLRLHHQMRRFGPFARLWGPMAPERRPERQMSRS